MALVFMDSFQHYSDMTNATLKWSSLTDNPTYVAGVGRWGGGAISFGDQDILGKSVPAQVTYIMGCAIYMWSPPQTTAQIFQLVDLVTVHTELRMRTDGKLETYRAGTSLGGVGTTVFATGSWHYIEALMTIHDSAGVFTVRVDGVTEINQTGLDTRNGANGWADVVRLRSGSGTNFGFYANDFYLCNTSGGSPTNTFLGDCRVECLFPNGNGNSSQLVGSDGNSTNNYQLVDETSPNDADYVQSGTVGEKDTYTYTDLATASGTVYGVQPVTRAAKTDAGTRTIVSVARLSGTETDSAAITLGGTADYLEDIRETKPGGGAWTISDVNSAEFGVKVNS